MELTEAFKEAYGAYPTAVYSAAGRVNLIGEHVDYCGGKVLPAALSLKCRVAVRPNHAGVLRIAATDLSESAEIDLSHTETYRGLRLWKYQAGVAHVLKEEGYRLVGCDLLYDCSVPFGAGLSSSAAIEVATAYALAKTGKNRVDKHALALLCQRAEREYCGVNCGIMDQFVSANGRAGSALLLDCASLSFQYVPLNLRDCVFVLANSNAPHDLAAGKYNERFAEAKHAKELLSKRLHVSHLAEIQPYLLEEYRYLLPSVLYRRARHIVTECARVQRCAEALNEGKLEEAGELFRQSHLSLRDDYEVTGTELDALAQEAWDRPECLGSRMTGGGFGGCTVSIVKRDKTEKFTAAVGEGYRKRTGREATFFVAEIADGIREEDISKL